MGGPAAGAPANPGDRQPVWRSPAIELEARAFALGDVDGDGKPDILLADETHVYAYPQAGDFKAFAQFDIPVTGARVISLEAADLDKNGRAEVFVTLHNSLFERVETYVLQLKDKSFEKVATLPYMVRSFQDEAGATQLAAQQLVDDATFPYGTIYTLAYKDGKYVTDKTVKARRLEWIYGFALAKDASGESFPLFITVGDKLRAQFKKGAFISQQSYGQTGNRLRWHDRDRAMMFRPRLLTVQDQGLLRGVYIVENVPGLGTLGGSFGLYIDGKLHGLAWDGINAKPAWTTGSLGGWVCDLAMVPGPTGQPQELWVAVMGQNGRVSVEKFLP
jgi:hypothetical protein